jgi:hypothetical protein
MNFSDAELEAYLDETLDPARAGEIEQHARQDRRLLERLAAINGRRNAGVHTLSEIWRRNQVGVPSREELSQFLLGTLPPEHADYIRFRTDVLKCRFTAALLGDLQEQLQRAKGPETSQRRSRYYESGAGFMQKRKNRRGS